MRSEFLALCDEVDLPKDMQEYDKETGRFKYRTASVMWLGFSKAWEKRQTEVDDLQKRVDAVKKLIQSYKDEEKDLEFKEWGHSAIYGSIAAELEQALKGKSNESST